MEKNFQVVLDFLVNLKSDKSQVERLAKEARKLAESFLRARQETEQLVAKQKLAPLGFYAGEIVM